jgi:hypothetical protein
VKFLELSGVGRVVADGTNEDGAHAARMDEWVGMGGGGEGGPEGRELICLFLLFTFPFLSFVRGTRTPRLAHSAPPRAKDSLCCCRPAEGRLLVPFVFLGHISLGD